ncbi:MAG: pilus assembly protein TadG-related protein [Massilia sp.]
MRAIAIPSASRQQQNRSAQRGQALVFTLLFAAVTALVCLVLYNSGKLANTRSQLQNAADAGAYSGAVLLARDHNFAAYTNRAMVANQVSVAQLVSLKSYLDDAAGTHRRMRGGAHTAVANLVPVFKPTWTIASNLPIETEAAAFDASAPLAVKGLDELIRVVQLAQEAHHDATALNVSLVANQVVQRNDPDASVSLMTFQTAYTAGQIRDWAVYTTRQHASDRSASADRFARVVVDQDSTDQFIRKRGSVLTAGWISMATEAACPALIPALTIYGFDHAGGTILSANEKRWMAMDATQGGGFVSCVTEVGIPVGYPLIQDGAGGSAGALAGTNGGYGSRTGFAGNPAETSSFGGAMNGLTAIPGRARYRRGPGTSLDATTGGLQDYYREVADTTNTPANQSAELNGAAKPFTIEVRREAATIRTSSRVVGNGAATIKADDQMKGDSMRALASGAAYFFRPNRDSNAFTRTGWGRADNRTEMANLFNPYWQAQLVENPTAALVLSTTSP